MESSSSAKASQIVGDELERLSLASTSSSQDNNVDCEEAVMVQVQQEEQQAPMLDSDFPGHLNNLTIQQRELLWEFWALILEYLSNDEYITSQRTSAKKRDNQADPLAQSSSKQNRELAQTVRANAASSTSSLKSQLSSSTLSSPALLSSPTASESSSSSSMSSQRSEHVLRGHPLALEFWLQLSTDDPDVMLLRFLRARKWVLEDAFAMYLECLKWRRRFGVQRIMRLGEAMHRRELFTSGKGFFWGVDRHQRLIIYLTARWHNRNGQTLQETMNHTVYQIEVGRRLFQPGTETVVVVFDLKDATLASLDFGSIQFMVSCFQSHYPECLSRVLVLDAPWIFWGFWKMVKPLLDPVVQDKVIFIDDREHLKTFIADDMLLQRFGGSSLYRYEYVPPLSSSSPVSSPPTPSSPQASSPSSSPVSSSNLSVTEEDIPPAGPIPLTEEQVQRINGLLEDKWKPAFLQATLHLCALRGDEHLAAAQPTIALWRERRCQAQQNIRRLLKRLELHYLPDNLYHRIGVAKRAAMPLSSSSKDDDEFEDFEVSIRWRC